MATIQVQGTGSIDQKLRINEITNKQRVTTSLIAGAIAGGVAKSATAPLDRTKINFQASTTMKYTTREMISFMHQSWTQQGLSSLWRGNSATMARVIPYAAVQFTAFEQWKRILKVDQRKNSELRRFLSGSLAGVSAISVTYPLDLAKARLAVTNQSQYKGLRDVLVKTVQLEGIGALFKGYGATMMGIIPYAGMSFYTYELCKRTWTKKYGEGSVGHVERFLFGIFAGAPGQLTMYPLDVVRRRLQTTSQTDKGSFRIFKMLVHIARTEGPIRGLYKGLSMNTYKGPLTGGISFCVYEMTQQFLRSQLNTA